MSANISDLYADARSGERRPLGRLLSVVERGGPGADELSGLIHGDSGSAHIIGITGSPGSGKSTLVGQLVQDLVASGHKPAVLAVDPSSPLTGGAILGDRVRIDDGKPISPAIAGSPTLPFIRSMATRGHSGGLALAVPLAVRLFDAVGYDPVIIETVGVGQVEVDVVGAADTAVVVMTPGMGDSVQANKAGLLEVADLFVVNKADRPGAEDVRRDLDLMLDLSHMTGQESDTGYRPPIIMASALHGDGTADVWTAATAHLEHLDDTGLRAHRRNYRLRTEIRARVEHGLAIAADALMDSDIGLDLVSQTERSDVAPNDASTQLLALLLNQPEES